MTRFIVHQQFREIFELNKIIRDVPRAESQPETGGQIEIERGVEGLHSDAAHQAGKCSTIIV